MFKNTQINSNSFNIIWNIMRLNKEKNVFLRKDFKSKCFKINLTNYKHLFKRKRFDNQIIFRKKTPNNTYIHISYQYIFFNYIPSE